MTAVIRTERLVLRPLEARDAQRIAAALAEWAVTRWLTVVPFPYVLEDAKDFIRAILEDPAEPTWAIDAGEGLIGVVSAGTELGYWLSRTHHGKGVMTEAAGRVAAWHFSSASRPLRSGYHLGNAHSCRVLEKLGFRPGEIEAVHQVSIGKPVDIQRMWLTHADWLALAHTPQPDQTPGDAAESKG